MAANSDLNVLIMVNQNEHIETWTSCHFADMFICIFLDVWILNNISSNLRFIAEGVIDDKSELLHVHLQYGSEQGDKTLPGPMMTKAIWHHWASMSQQSGNGVICWHSVTGPSVLSKSGSLPTDLGSH